jgi:hypothetical protein
MGVSSLDRNTDNELGEVAHGRQKMGVTGSRYSSAGTPEIAMQDEHGCGDGPAKEDFAVTANTLVCKDAMRAFPDPIDDVLTTTWPEESHPNAEQSFVDAKVTTNGAAMKNIEN